MRCVSVQRDLIISERSSDNEPSSSDHWPSGDRDIGHLITCHIFNIRRDLVSAQNSRSCHEQIDRHSRQIGHFHSHGTSCPLLAGSLLAVDTFAAGLVISFRYCTLILLKSAPSNLHELGPSQTSFRFFFDLELLSAARPRPSPFDSVEMQLTLCSFPGNG